MFSGSILDEDGAGDIRSISVLATQERSYVGLTGFGIEVAGTILVED